MVEAGGGDGFFGSHVVEEDVEDDLDGSCDDAGASGCAGDDLDLVVVVEDDGRGHA